MVATFLCEMCRLGTFRFSFFFLFRSRCADALAFSSVLNEQNGNLSETATSKMGKQECPESHGEMKFRSWLFVLYRVCLENRTLRSFCKNEGACEIKKHINKIKTFKAFTENQSKCLRRVDFLAGGRRIPNSSTSEPTQVRTFLTLNMFSCEKSSTVINFVKILFRGDVAERFFFSAPAELVLFGPSPGGYPDESAPSTSATLQNDKTFAFATTNW